MNILVTGVGSTLGYGILQCVRKASSESKVFGTDYLDSAIGLYEVEQGYILPDILKDKDLETKWLLAVIKLVTMQNIEFLFVGLDFEVPVFAKYKKDIEDISNCKIIVSSSEVVEICNDKWLTYLFLSKKGFLVPRSCLPEDVPMFLNSVRFPWIIKPRVGSTSNGLFRVTNQVELEYALLSCDDAIIQEEVGIMNDEFTCGVVSVGSKIISSIALRRTLKNGNTQMATYEKDDELDNYIRNVALELGSFGPINIQLRLTEEGPKIFEINPRFSGTTSIRAEFGLNEVKILLNYLDGQDDNPSAVINEGVVIRYPSEKFVSLTNYATAKRL